MLMQYLPIPEQIICFSHVAWIIVEVKIQEVVSNTLVSRELLQLSI
jgi:hypothetical protein